MIADLILAAIRFLPENWPSLLVIAAAFLLRKRIPPIRLPQPKDWQACAIVAAVSLAVSLGAAALHGMPRPSWHDDYGNVLIADTFAHGRLANPPHPLSDFFETMMVLQRPAYAAKYPPGLGAVLALGFPAVWVLAALTCAAIWWALRAWISPELAFVGGLLTAIHPTMLSWAESYHGGSLAALAGALLLGSVPRTLPVVAGIAVALFAYSRPYEGLILTIAIALVLRPRKMWPAIPVAIAALIPLAIYNRAVTGSAFTLPYTIYEQRYDPVPNFLWESPRAVAPEPNLEMATVYRVVYGGHWWRIHRPGGMREELAHKIEDIGIAVFGPYLLILLVPLVAWWRVLKQRTGRLLTAILILFAFAPFSIIWWMELHYLAPGAVVVAALMVLLIAELPPSFAAAVLVAFVVNAASVFVDFVRTPEGGREAARRAIAAEVKEGVIVVAPNLFEMVYNGADIDGQRVIWARDLGPQRNAALRAYYRGRKFWYLPTDEWSGPGRPRPLP